MKGIKIGLLRDTWWLGTDAVNNINQPLYKYINTNIVHNLNLISNKFNNCRSNPPNYHHIYVISDTGAT